MVWGAGHQRAAAEDLQESGAEGPAGGAMWIRFYGPLHFLWLPVTCRVNPGEGRARDGSVVTDELNSIWEKKTHTVIKGIGVCQCADDGARPVPSAMLAQR